MSVLDKSTGSELLDLEVFTGERGGAWGNGYTEDKRIVSVLTQLHAECACLY